MNPASIHTSANLLQRRPFRRLFLALALAGLSHQSLEAQTINQVLSAAGDGVNRFDGSAQSAVDLEGSVYVAGFSSHNVFSIRKDGSVREIIDKDGDGQHQLSHPSAIAIGPDGAVYVAGHQSHNVFEITRRGRITEIIDTTGDGTNALIRPFALTVSASGKVYVTSDTDDVFEIDPSGTVKKIIGANGDATNSLDDANYLATDQVENVYVSGRGSHNVFRIQPNGTITQIIGPSGDGTNSLVGPEGLAVDSVGNVFVTGTFSANVFKISPSGSVTEVLDVDGDGQTSLIGPNYLVADQSGSGKVYVLDNNNVFEISGTGAVDLILAGSDENPPLPYSSYASISPSGDLYLTSSGGSQVFQYVPPHFTLSNVAGLILPSFEVDLESTSGPTTLFAIQNTTGSAINGSITYFGTVPSGELDEVNFALASHATLNLDMRSQLDGLGFLHGTALGFAVFTTSAGTPETAIEGDFFRYDPSNDFATGERMIRPNDLCVRQEVRFLDFGSGSELRIMLDRPRDANAPSFSYSAYNTAGQTVVSNATVWTSDVISVFDLANLVPGEDFGKVTFDFSNAGGGWVSAKYSAFSRFSSEIASACLDPYP